MDVNLDKVKLISGTATAVISLGVALYKAKEVVDQEVEKRSQQKLREEKMNRKKDSTIGFAPR